MKKTILNNRYLLLLALVLLTAAFSVSASYTVARYTKTVDIGRIKLEFTTEKPSEQKTEPFNGKYTVQAGDTLSGIAEMYGTSVEKLQVYNDIDGTVIYAGQIISIPPRDYVIPEQTAEPPSEPTDTEPTDTEPTDTEPTDTEPTDTETTEPHGETNDQ